MYLVPTDLQAYTEETYGIAKLIHGSKEILVK